MNYKLLVTIIISVSIGVLISTGFNTFNVDKEITPIDINTELELRLQSEIESNQEMTQMVDDVINACNEKLLDKYNNTNEKLKKENEILQKTLSKYRDI